MNHQAVQPDPALQALLRGVIPGIDLEVLPSVDSTNSELMRRARQGRCQPVLLVAQHQSAGRGRMGRDWHSAPSGQHHGASLTFSVSLPLRPRSWLGLSLAAGACVAGALQAMVDRSKPAAARGAMQPILLKWPNDLWWQGRKLGGILIETVLQGDTGQVILGLGLNIALPNAHDSLSSAVEMRSWSVAPAALIELDPAAEAASTLSAVAPPLLLAIKTFEHDGFAAFRDAYLARDLLAGQRVCVTDRTGAQTEAWAAGITEQGALLLHTEHGVQEVVSAEVSVRPTGSNPLA